MNRRPAVVALVGLVIVLTTGVLGYMEIEGWSLLDAVWMVVITLTTIGFGEVHPLTDHGRLFTVGLILAGLGIGTYTTGQITAMIVEGGLGQMLRARRRRRQMETLDKHTIVVGYGRLGRTIVQELQAAGVPVAVIEQDPALVGEIERGQICPVVVGDGADDEVLRAAGVHRARGLAVAVSNPAQAVFVTLSAREMNHTLNIVTRVADAEHALKAKRAGATSVVSPHTMGGWRMAHGIVRPHASTFLDLATLGSHEDVQFEEFIVAPASPLLRQTLGDLRLRDRFRVVVVAIRRQAGSIVPAPGSSESAGEGDVIIVVGAPASVRSLAEFLRN